MLDSVRMEVCRCFGVKVGCDLHQLRSVARSQCEGLSQYRGDDGFKLFVTAAGAQDKPNDEWFDGLLTVLGEGPPTDWGDGVETVVKAKLAVYAESLRDWQLLKRNEDTLAVEQHEGVELILLSLKRHGRDTMRVVVPCETAPTSQFAELVESVTKVIESVDEKYRLALLASVVEDHVGETPTAYIDVR